MNLSPINVYSINANSYSCNNCQTVNFGKKTRLPVSENTKKSVSATQRMVNLSPERYTINRIRCCFDIPIIPFYSEKDLMENCTKLEYKKNPTSRELEANGIVMRIPKWDNLNKLEKTVFSMGIAHQYTHALQIKNNEDPEQLLYEDILKAGLPEESLYYIQQYAEMSFDSILENYKEDIFQKVLGIEGKESANSNMGLIFIFRNIDEDIIAKALGFTDANIAKRQMIDKLKFIDIASEMLCHDCPSLNEKCKLNKEQTKASIRQVFINYYRNRSKSEKEAHQAENMIAAKQNYYDKGSELASMYYALMEEVFS